MLRELTAVFLISKIPALWAGEVAVFETGFRMRIERHELAGSQVRLFTSKDAYIEFPASYLAAIEIEEFVPPPSPPSASDGSHAPRAAAAVAMTPSEAKALVREAAEQYGLPPSLLHLVAQLESGYNPYAVSAKGAIGIMQLMPATAAALEADPHDPQQNVEAGARFLRQLLLQYKNHPDQLRLALAAYNAGPGAVKRYGGVPPYRETQRYVERIVEAYRRSLFPLRRER
ncbi:MAG: lytic transglycosylase domain-containing protein [Bryobacteraceae bacterium]|nr:lytic transglycosylase domain-containing protein [Bryobacteraceae bacterium]MDW8376831.1 lytic transglycosylase domain-containing protein [Bryobacterales bacterium]